jgi:mono/diheme cytochrome c family protein
VEFLMRPLRGRKRSVFSLSLFATLALAGAPSGAAGQDSGASVWDDVYTEGQAERGSVVLAQKCVECHGVNLKGGPGVPPLVGLEFSFGWDTRSLGELYEYLVTTMPTGQPGSLSDQAYVDIIAAVLKLNGIPAGEEGAELAPDTTSLGQIMLTFKPPE